MSNKAPSKPERKLFAELIEGVEAIKLRRQGKVILRTHKVAVIQQKKTDRKGRASTR